MATDSFCFLGGTRALCCATAASGNDQQLTDFKNTLKNFEEQTCPAGYIYAKRSLESRAAGPSGHDIFGLMNALAGLGNPTTYVQTLEVDAVNEVMSPYHLNSMYIPISSISFLGFVEVA